MKKVVHLLPHDQLNGKSSRWSEHFACSGAKCLVLGLLFGVTVTLAAPPQQQSNAFRLWHSNDINLLGETSGAGSGDDRLTGVLGLGYQEGVSCYEMILNSYTQRHLSQGERVDTLSLGYLRQLATGEVRAYRYDVQAGVSFKRSGNFGGEGLQNGIHTLTGNPHYPLSFSDETHSTLGIAGRVSGSYTLHEAYHLYHTLALEFNSDKSGTQKLELGLEWGYGNSAFWVGGVTQYLRPFDHTIVKFSTPDAVSTHLLFGASIAFSKRYKLLLESTVGGAPLGEEGDYSSQISLYYFWE